MSILTVSPDVALFEGLDVPQIVPDDSARARLTDPIQSHMAADRSQKSIKTIRDRVLRLVAFDGPQLSGTRINNLYRSKTNWSEIHFDSPRKRAGELARDGLLRAERVTGDGHPRPEAVYSITDAGLKAIS